MTRMTRFATVFGLTAATTCAIVAASGGSRSSPAAAPGADVMIGGEAPVPGTADAAPSRSARTPLQPVRRSAASAELGFVLGPPADAGTSDGYEPPLPPVPDGGIPDSRIEPRATE